MPKKKLSLKVVPLLPKVPNCKLLASTTIKSLCTTGSGAIPATKVASKSARSNSFETPAGFCVTAPTVIPPVNFLLTLKIIIPLVIALDLETEKITSVAFGFCDIWLP